MNTTESQRGQTQKKDDTHTTQTSNIHRGSKREYEARRTRPTRQTEGKNNRHTPKEQRHNKEAANTNHTTNNNMTNHDIETNKENVSTNMTTKNTEGYRDIVEIIITCHYLGC